MLYLDANVFVYGALNQEDLGNRARSLLRKVQHGELLAASSALTFDELVWAVKRYRGIVDAVAAGEAFLNMPGLRLIDVSGELLSLALQLMRGYKLDPRDSIHAASAISANAEKIVSSDEDFDRVKEVQRTEI